MLGCCAVVVVALVGVIEPAAAAPGAVTPDDPDAPAPIDAPTEDAPAAPEPSADAAPREDEAPTPAEPPTRREPPPPVDTSNAAPERGAWRRPPIPPRLDGTYLGAVLGPGIALARVNGYSTDGAFAGTGAAARVGQMILPWLGLGISAGGSFAVRSERSARQRVGLGYFFVDATFVPIPRRNLTVRASFGFGGGAVRQEGKSGRGGFGGAMFGAGVRYDFFPLAARKRPNRGGGFAVGPELSWIGATPAARGRPMANVIVLGLATTFYFGT